MKINLRFKRMAALCSDAGRVLDVGWSAEPNPFLTNPEVVGLDLNEAPLPVNYRDCLVGDVMDLPEPFGENTFDAVVAGEIIEHLERPLDFLRGCRKLLSPGGRLILSTPNPHYPVEILLTLTLNRKYFYTPNHICLYPQRWLIRMMETAGFEEVSLSSGGVVVPGLGDLPFFRTWCYQYIAVGRAVK